MEFISAEYNTDNNLIDITSQLRTMLEDKKIIINMNKDKSAKLKITLELELKNDKTNFFTTKDFGFILLRCVLKPEDDLLWKEAYRCIRNFYEEEIIIIDDNSNQDLISNIPLQNTRIIYSDYPKRGELLPYFYLFKLRLFKKAVILHDSMFIQNKLYVNNIDAIKFLWYFDSKSSFEAQKVERLLALLNNHLALLTYCKQHTWYGCFGVASVVSLDFINLLHEKYNFFILLNYINTKDDRMVLERILGIIVFFELNITVYDCSLFNSIADHFRAFQLTYEQYTKIKKSNQNIIKIWVGR